MASTFERKDRVKIKCVKRNERMVRKGKVRR